MAFSVYCYLYCFILACSLPSYLLNGLYLRNQHRAQSQDNASFGVLEEFAKQGGIRRIRHGINPYHDLTTTPPEGFSPNKANVVRLQTVVEEDGSPKPLYNDLGFNKEKVNEPQEVTHYQKSVLSGSE